MSKIEAFFKENRKPAGEVRYVASGRFTDEDGNPIEWILKPVPTEIMEDIKDRTDFYADADKMMGRFAMETTIATVKFPDLRDVSLQKSYGVSNQKQLLYELLNTAELDMLKVKVLDVNGYGEDFNALAGEAKN